MYCSVLYHIYCTVLYFTICILCVVYYIYWCCSCWLVQADHGWGWHWLSTVGLQSEVSLKLLESFTFTKLWMHCPSPTHHLHPPLATHLPTHPPTHPPIHLPTQHNHVKFAVHIWVVLYISILLSRFLPLLAAPENLLSQGAIAWWLWSQQTWLGEWI